jgi:hypothetical protein
VAWRRSLAPIVSWQVENLGLDITPNEFIKDEKGR